MPNVCCDEPVFYSGRELYRRTHFRAANEASAERRSTIMIIKIFETVCRLNGICRGEAKVFTLIETSFEFRNHSFGRSAPASSELEREDLSPNHRLIFGYYRRFHPDSRDQPLHFYSEMCVSFLRLAVSKKMFRGRLATESCRKVNFKTIISISGLVVRDSPPIQQQQQPKKPAKRGMFSLSVKSARVFPSGEEL